MKKFAGIAVFLLLISLGTVLRAEEEDRFGVGTKEDTDKLLYIGLGGYAGENFLLKGYDQRKKSNIFGGGEVDAGLAEKGYIPKYRLRLSVDYIPLTVLDGPYGMSESLRAITLGFVFNPRPDARVSYFIGPGVGYYFDAISLDTPATGQLSHTYNFLGFNISGGVRIRLSPRLFLSPELRYHMVREPDPFWATHLNFQIGLNYIIINREYKKWD